MGAPERYSVHDIVMFDSGMGVTGKHIGIVVSVGGENTYRVRFFYDNVKRFGTPIAVVGPEVEFIGHLPHGTELDWDA